MALALAGGLWGLTVPLTKLGLDWLGAGWLAVARFAVAAPILPSSRVAGCEARSPFAWRARARSATGW